MNTKQTKILKWAIAVITIMLLFPPFEAYHLKIGTVKSGYAFIFSGLETSGSIAANINASQLIVQWLGVLIITGLLCLVYKDD
jgi:hypothetical protein